MTRRYLRPALFGVDLFAGATALVGGSLMLVGAESFPTEWLTGSPFADYRIPGLILAVVVGGSASVAALAVALRSRLGGPVSAVAGAIMVGWIAGELALLSQNGAATSPRSPVEAVYGLVGLAMMALGVAAWRRTRTDS